MKKEKKSSALIAPSILSANFMKLGEELQALEAAGADLVHVDVMDGHFVPNLTIGPPVIAQMKTSTRLPLDVHLMIEHADQWVEDYVEAGAQWLTVHVEAVPHLHRCLEGMRARHVKSGVSLNPATPLSALDEVLEYCDHVLIMSVNPGFGGQKFIPSSLKKIEALRTRIEQQKLKTLIEVDGGVTQENAPQILAAGAHVLVAGTAVFKGGAIQKNISLLRGSNG